MLALVLSACASLPAAPAGVDKDALAKLQGTWQLTSQEHGGKKSDAKEIAAITLEVKGAKFTIRDGVDVKEDASVEALDSKAKPTTIDVKITAGPDLDKVVKGLWKRDGDALTICVAEPGKERPKEFAAKEGTGHTLFVFRLPKK
jgi:uncharacterized protein (TIGR03067 family)